MGSLAWTFTIQECMLTGANRTRQRLTSESFKMESLLVVVGGVIVTIITTHSFAETGQLVDTQSSFRLTGQVLM